MFYEVARVFPVGMKCGHIEIGVLRMLSDYSSNHRLNFCRQIHFEFKNEPKPCQSAPTDSETSVNQIHKFCSINSLRDFSSTLLQQLEFLQPSCNSDFRTII